MGFWCPRLGSSFPTGPLGPTIIPHGTAELRGLPSEPSTDFSGISGTDGHCMELNFQCFDFFTAC